MPASRRPRIRSAAALVLIAGCGSADPATRPFTQRDSAGIRIVESTAPVSDAGHAWRVAPDADWSFGLEGAARGGDVPLSGVVDVRQVGNHVIFGNRGSDELFVLDGAGREVRRLGGTGDGPGELRGIGRLFACNGRTLAVARAGSLDIFDVREGFVRRIPAPSNTRLVVLGLGSGCEIALIRGERRIPPVGAHGYHRREMHWAGADLRPLALAYEDSVAGAWTRVNPAGGPLVPRLPPWSPAAIRVVIDSMVIAGTGARPELVWRHRTRGLLRIARWAQQARPVTRVDEALYAEKRRRALQRFGRTPDALFAFTRLSDWPEVPTHKPFFDDIRVDPAGNVWLLRNPGTLQGYEAFPPEETTPDQTWLVLDSAGRWLGDVAMPGGFLLHDVTERAVLGVHRDPLGVETVRRHSLSREAEPRD